MHERTVAARDAVVTLHDVVLAGEKGRMASDEASRFQFAGHVFRNVDQLTADERLQRACMLTNEAFSRSILHGFLG
jgi:hypothetical protein